MLTPLLIFLGSGLGGILRYWLGGWVQRAHGGPFPLGTLSVNTIGCLAIGFLAALFAGRPSLLAEQHRLALTVGLLGGFTTFSAFGYETFALIRADQHPHAALNVTLSFFAALGAVWFGYWAGARA
jgi:fluoride exporter